MKRIFLAGIIQGSLAEPAVHDQDYRPRIRQLVERFLPEAEVYCPVSAHPDSLRYDDRKGRAVFLHHVRLARQSDMVIAYLPAASMGTAIELWEAHRGGVPIVAITPLTVNWVVRFLCDLVVGDLDGLAEACRDGRLAGLLKAPRPRAGRARSRGPQHMDRR